MRALARLLPPGSVPELVFEDEAHRLVAMTAVPDPHTNWKADLLSGRVEPQRVRRFGELLPRIHRGGRSLEEELRASFADRSWFHALRVEPYYLYPASQVPEAAGFLEALAAGAGRPAWTLVHGDYSPKNVLVHGDRMVLVDHEVVHWGDGAFDVGFSLAHLLSKAHHLRSHRGAFLGAAGLYWSAYRAALGDPPDPGLEARAVRHAIGCLLARAVGRSKLKYLAEDERRRQARLAVLLSRRPPRSVGRLVARFARLLAGLESGREGVPA